MNWRPLIALALFGVPCGAAAESTIKMGASVGSFYYQEQIPSPGRSVERGVLPGIRMLYKKKRGAGNEWDFRAGLGISVSSLTYDGTNQSGSVAVVSQHSHLFADLSFGAERRLFDTGETSWIEGYADLGFAFWKRGEFQIVNGITSYREDYAWLFAPLGIRWCLQFGDAVLLKFDVALKPAFLGAMKAYLVESGIATGDPTFDLGPRFGYRGQLDVGIRLSPSAWLWLSPWTEYSAIGQSGNVTFTNGGAIFEPSSSTIQYGATAGVEWRL